MSQYPAYSRSERIADGAMHCLGLGFAICGAVAIIIFAMDASAATITSVAVYGAALIATFLASACYHMTPWETIRPALRRVDHAAIYLKIAGTYTPLVVFLGSGFAYLVLGLVWALALTGAVMKIAFWKVPGRFGPALYLIMGWLSVLLLLPLARSLPGAALYLIVAGGLLYSAGVPFYAAEKMRFSNAIWHGFVLAASICFFAAIFLAVG